MRIPLASTVRCVISPIAVPRAAGAARARLLVAGELAVHAPVGALDVLEDDVHLVGRGLADRDHGLGDGGDDLALLLVGAARVPLHGDVGHGDPPVTTGLT